MNIRISKDNIAAGGYTSPSAEVLTMYTEQCFATSPDDNYYGAEGEAGILGDGNDYDL